MSISTLTDCALQGEFTDEFGVLHTGGPQYKLTHWEVFNEPEGCHGLDVQGYTEQYDAVVSELAGVLLLWHSHLLVTSWLHR